MALESKSATARFYYFIEYFASVLSYFPIAVIRHHGQGSLEKKVYSGFTISEGQSPLPPWWGAWRQQAGRRGDGAVTES